ncbi:MAG: hypothetical protein HY828_18005 [Actinobacteria bacterium]|nr:hypothetical protein [Actinomycetota bacterium]
MDAPLPPPTDPFAMPPMVQVAEHVPTPPSRRAWPWVIGAVAAVIAVVGVVVFATRGDSDAGYSLEAAAEAASEAQNVEFETTITQMGTTATSTGRFDVERQLMAMRVQIPDPVDTEFDGVLDIEGAMIYMDASMMGDVAAVVPTKWISMDLSAVPGLAEVFQSSRTSNPLDVAKFFTTASSVEEVGMEDVRGEQAKHYLVTVTMADVFAKFPELGDTIDEMGVTMEDEVVYDVWVDEANQLRRVKYATTVNGQEQSMDTFYESIGDIEPIVVPSPDEVTDISDMLGG